MSKGSLANSKDCSWAHIYTFFMESMAHKCDSCVFTDIIDPILYCHLSYIIEPTHMTVAWSLYMASHKITWVTWITWDPSMRDIHGTNKKRVAIFFRCMLGLSTRSHYCTMRGTCPADTRWGNGHTYPINGTQPMCRRHAHEHNNEISAIDLTITCVYKCLAIL